MQDRTYSDLLFLIQSLIGSGNLTSEEQGSIESFINRRAHEIFQTSQSWPRFLVTSEKRRIVGLSIENAAGTSASDINGDYYILGTQKSGGSSVAKVGSIIYSKTTSADDGSTIDGTTITFSDGAGTAFGKFTSDNGFQVGDDGTGAEGVDSKYTWVTLTVTP